MASAAQDDEEWGRQEAATPRVSSSRNPREVQRNARAAIATERATVNGQAPAPPG